MNEMKTCPACGEVKSKNYFTYNVRRKKSDPTCKACRKAQNYERYWRDPEASRAKNKVRYQHATATVDFAKEISGGCVDCEESDIVCLSFIHRPDEIKLFKIACGAKVPKNRLMAEIRKCDVVCANCQKRRQARKTGNRHAKKMSA